jgi:hypothetical protein
LNIAQVEPFRSGESYVVCCSAELHESHSIGILVVCPKRGKEAGAEKRKF